MNDIFETLSGGCSFRGEGSRRSGALFSPSLNRGLNARNAIVASSSPSTRRRAHSGADPLDFFAEASAPPAAKAGSSSSGSKKAKKKRKRKRANKVAEARAVPEVDGVAEAEKNDPRQARIRAEEVAQFRAKLKIKVTGSLVSDPFETFHCMLNAEWAQVGHEASCRTTGKLILSNIEEMEYKEPTPVQMQSIPCLLGGRDVLVCAPTGSGKTAAFLIPLIMKLRVPRKNHGLRALVISPTRELAVQIMREFERLSQGKKFRARVLKKSTAQALLASGSQTFSTDFMVCTPMRLVTMIKEGSAKLSTVETLVLDEADKLFEMGFLEQVDEIIAACGADGSGVQRAMFSATIPPKIEELASSVLRDPVHIRVGAVNAGASTISQKLVFVGQEEGKLLAFRQLVQEGKLKPPAIVFVQSKERAKDLYAELVYDGINVDAIHAERTQAKRDAIVRRFRSGELWVLIATDLMGRGVDFKGVNMVINYDFPQSAVSYIHRIGRTGRAGHKGEAVTMFTIDDLERLRTIANVMRASGCEVPEWMLKMKKQSRRKLKEQVKRPPKRKRILNVSRYDRRKQQRGKKPPKKSEA